MTNEKNENLKIWDACKHIDQSHTKQAKVDGNSCLTVNGVEMTRLLTAALGPIGKSWKYEIVSHELVETAPIPNFDVMALNHTLLMRFWVNHGEGWQSFEQFGHTKARYLAGRGGSNPYVAFDDEYAKKSATDALKKCMSLLGVAADVYSGDLDNHEYRNEVMDKQAIAKADEKQDEQIKMIEEIKALTADAVECISKFSESEELAARRTIKPTIGKLANRQQAKSKAIAKAAAHGLSVIESEISQKFKKDDNQ